MKKFIEYEKLSKKERRKLDLQRRKTWQGLSPVTRKTKNKKLYDRKAFRKGVGDDTAFTEGLIFSVCI